MAETREFVNELDGQIGSIRTSLNALSDTIGERATTLKRLGVRRQEIIGSVVVVLLPNLDPATVVALGEKLPGFITPEQVKQQLDEMVGNRRDQLLQLNTKLGNYDANLAVLRGNLASARSDLTFPELADDKDMAMLTKAGYGTERYRVKWYDLFSGDLTFFRHWKKADELVQFYKAEDFAALSAQYAEQVAIVAAIAKAEKELHDFTAAKALREEVSKALDNVPVLALERIQSKLKSYLDTLSPVPEWMQDLANIDSRIATLIEEQRKDQDAHNIVSTNLTKLGELKAKVVRSGKKNVPDQYVTAIRGNGNSSASASGNTVHVHTGGGGYYGGSGFFSGVLWGEMDSYFAQERAYERGRRDASYGYGGGGGYGGSHSHVSSPSWQQADTSGQS